MKDILQDRRSSLRGWRKEDRRRSRESPLNVGVPRIQVRRHREPRITSLNHTWLKHKRSTHISSRISRGLSMQK